eukprot:COSAG02_NODE_313_length_24939_cov_470.394485_20_plen_298_part_00
MDLYGSGASIAQANAQTQQAREINQATQDFNNSLAEQLDQSNLDQDEDRTSKLQKNILSGATSGGKLAMIGKNQKARKAAATSAGGFTELPITKEETLAREAGAERAPLTNLTAVNESVENVAEGATTETYTAEGKLAEQEAAKASEVAGSAGVKSSAEVAAESVGKLAGKAATVGKVGVAGLGGGIDAFQDVGRIIEGKSDMDIFGSNTASRIGNIGNIIGSGLEVAGVATGGITPWSIGLEALGATISLASSITEGIGEEEAGEQSKEAAQKDITSQARGITTSDVVTQAVGRTQ